MARPRGEVILEGEVVWFEGGEEGGFEGRR